MTEQQEIRAKTIIFKYCEKIKYPKAPISPMMEEVMLEDVYNVLDEIFGDERLD